MAEVEDGQYHGSWVGESAAHFRDMVARGILSPKDAERGLQDEIEVMERGQRAIENHERDMRAYRRRESAVMWLILLGVLVGMGVLCGVIRLVR